MTVREQLESVVEKSDGRITPPLLRREWDLLQVLLEFRWVVEDWRDATRGRRGGMDGISTLDHEKLWYWRQNREYSMHEVTQWQLDTMLSMDEKYLAELQTPLAESNEKEREDG